VVPVLLQTDPEVTSRCLHPLRVEFFLSQGLAPLKGLPYLVRDRPFNARSRGCSFTPRARLFRRCNRARSGRRGQADVTSCHGPPASTP
jgi:hypothetical protein